MIRLLLLTAALAGTLTTPVQVGEWQRADPAYAWDFPRDHGPHPGYKTEWWYFTGLLAEDGQAEPTLGYQFTIFKVGIVPERPTADSPWATPDVLMGHLAVSDLETGRHEFSEVLYRAAPPLASFGPGGSLENDGLIAWSLAPAGTPGRWELSFVDGGFRFGGAGPGVGLDLAADTTSAMIFQGPGGYSRKADREDRASMYYSYTDLETSGQVTLDGRTLEVLGTTWMDHEFSSDPLEESQVGWDWFSIRLEDGRALMAFQLRDDEGRPDFRHFTLVGADHSTRYLTEDEWTLTPGEAWISEETGAAYPVSWRLTLPGEGHDLSVRAYFPDQENVSRRIADLYYWEGAVTVESDAGQTLGEGYLEMTGYGKGSRPAL